MSRDRASRCTSLDSINRLRQLIQELQMGQTMRTKWRRTTTSCTTPETTIATRMCLKSPTARVRQLLRVLRQWMSRRGRGGWLDGRAAPTSPPPPVASGSGAAAATARHRVSGNSVSWVDLLRDSNSPVPLAPQRDQPGFEPQAVQQWMKDAVKRVRSKLLRMLAPLLYLKDDNVLLALVLHPSFRSFQHQTRPGTQYLSSFLLRARALLLAKAQQYHRQQIDAGMRQTPQDKDHAVNTADQPPTADKAAHGADGRPNFFEGLTSDDPPAHASVHAPVGVSDGVIVWEGWRRRGRRRRRG